MILLPASNGDTAGYLIPLNESTLQLYVILVPKPSVKWLKRVLELIRSRSLALSTREAKTEDMDMQMLTDVWTE